MSKLTLHREKTQYNSCVITNTGGNAVEITLTDYENKIIES